MSQRRLRDVNAANDAHRPAGSRGARLQVELEASVLETLLRDRRVQAEHLRACNPRSAEVIRNLLVRCLGSPEHSNR